MKMVSGVGIWVLMVLFVGMVPQESLGSRQSQSNCVASSCGQISNISHPFRRKDDPPNCGDRRYEIECVNDYVAVLRLSPDREAKYHVQAINYNNYTIRLVDPNIHEGDCSSIPRYFLYRFNFSDVIDYSGDTPPPSNRDVDLYHATQMQDGIQGVPLFDHIMYMSCNSAVGKDDEGDTGYPCLDSHTYVVAGDLNATGSRWKPGCCLVKKIAVNSANVSYSQYSDVHRAMVYGFELSWLHATCEDHCGSRPCYFNKTSHKVICYSICDYPHSTHGCGIWKRIRTYTIDIKGIIHDILYGN